MDEYTIEKFEDQMRKFVALVNSDEGLTAEDTALLFGEIVFRAGVEGLKWEDVNACLLRLAAED